MCTENQNYRLRRSALRDVPGRERKQSRLRQLTSEGGEKTGMRPKQGGRAPRSRGRGLTATQQRVPSRLAKRRLNERLKNDTAAFNEGNLADKMRREGYEEVPLDELQDRLSKMPGPLAAVILKGRM